MSKRRSKIITLDFPDGDYFTRSDLLASLQKKYPNYSSNDFSWVISDLLKRKILFRIGFNRYSKKPVLIYDGGRGEPLAEKTRSALLDNENLGRVVIYDSSFFNEWLNELIAHGTVIAEVDRRNMAYAFDILKASFPRAVVLYNPSLEELSRYAKSETIAVVPLYTRSPMLLGNGRMCIEKLCVDIFADRALREFFSIDESSKMAAQMLSAYSYDKKALLRYAARRKVSKDIENAILSSGVEAIKQKGD